MKKRYAFSIVVTLFLFCAVSVSAQGKLKTPTNVRVSVVDSGSVQVRWQSSLQKKRFAVEVRQSGQLVKRKTTTNKTVRFSSSFFTDGATYTARVRVKKTNNKKASLWAKKRFTYVQDDDPNDSPSCGDSQQLFTTSPVDTSKLMSIRPLGNLGPSAHTFPTRHLYLNRNSEVVGADYMEDILAPGEITITTVTSSANLTLDTVDYSIYFSPCSEVSGYFLHVLSLSSTLEESFTEPYDFCNEYETGGWEYRQCSKTLNVKVSAGAPLGQTGVQTFDLGLRDSRLPAPVYANQDRWGSEHLTVACPLDYFTPSIKADLYSFLGYANERRTEEPLCGEVAQDEPGTAQGMWFTPGTTNILQEDEQLALVHDNIDYTQGVFSVGTAAGDVASGRYQFTPEHSGLVNRDFDEVALDGNVYCYENEEEWSSTLLVQLTSEDDLSIDTGSGTTCGSGPWSLSDSAVFER